VASNGGIVGVSTPAATATVTVGFQPAKFLAYSPVARTTDGGKKWSTGALPSGLAQVADALATDTGGATEALERAKGGTVVRSAGSLTRWTPITTERALAATGPGAACGLRALSAVTVVAGAPEVGGDCTKPGVVGLFTDASGSWHATGPSLPGESGATMRVLRVTTTAAGTAALVEARSKTSESLLALWQEGGQPWTASAPVRVDGQVRSAGIGSSLSMLVVTAKGSEAAEVHSVAGPGSGWTSIAAPRGTQAVVGAVGSVGSAGSAGGGSPGGDLTALTVSGSWITVWSRGASGWERGRRFAVPIEYGSST
jgi:hypothetical protein